MQTDRFDLYMDGELYKENFDCLLIMFFNGKLGGGGMMMQPFAMINDGFINVSLVQNYGVKHLLHITELTKNVGGT